MTLIASPPNICFLPRNSEILLQVQIFIVIAISRVLDLRCFSAQLV